MWEFAFENSEQAEVTDFKCEVNEKFCSQAHEHMVNDFRKLVLTFDQDEFVYDQPMPFRQLLGLLKYFNDFNERPIETLHVEALDHALNIFFNCKDSSIEDVLSKPVASDFAEISFS